MPYGLVLEGGGAKGSYQLGSYMALQEENKDIRLVVGTSMGALNGAFVVQGNTDVLVKVWSMSTFDESRDLMESLAVWRGNIYDPIQLARTARAASRMDIRPLRELIHRHIDEDTIRAAEVDYGLVVYSLTEGKTKFLYLDDIPRGQLGKYILASCCYPVFSPIKIDGNLYVDGGIGNNLPYEMVLARGLDPIILRTNPLKAEDRFPEGATVIGPDRPVADTMHFDPILAPDRMRTGYRHAKRILGGYDGLDYTFFPIDEAEAMQRLSELFFFRKEDFRYLVAEKGSLERGIVETLWPQLARSLALPEAYSYKQLYLALIEARAQQLHFDPDRIYHADGLIREMEEKEGISPRVETVLERVLHLLFRGKRVAIG